MLVQILQDILETGNLANYTNEEAKGILEELYSITDEKILKEKYDRLKNIYIDERPYIGLYFSRVTTIFGKTLSINVNSNWSNPFYKIEEWHKRK